MSINSYSESILSSINFVQDYRFANTDIKFAELCEINLINYLQYLIMIYHSDIKDDTITAEEVVKKVNEKKEELLGETTLGEYSQLILYEALYYYRLLLIPDKLMHQLVHLINQYNSENKMKAITKINSLITFNICTYGAGTSADKPLLDLTVHEGITKEQKDLEVSIMFLLRNINDLNLTLAEPLYGHPVETLLLDSDDEEEELKPCTQDEIKSGEKSSPQLTEQSELCSREDNDQYTKGEITIFSLSVVFIIVLIAIIIQQYSHKGIKLN